MQFIAAYHLTEELEEQIMTTLNTVNEKIGVFITLEELKELIVKDNNKLRVSSAIHPNDYFEELNFDFKNNYVIYNRFYSSAKSITLMPNVFKEILMSVYPIDIIGKDYGCDMNVPKTSIALNYTATYITQSIV
jgi:hypothetical protein